MKTIEKVAEELKKQGLVPTMEDFGITFKYQMTNYLYIQASDDEDYFSLYVPYIFDVDEDNELDVLRAMNGINNGLKVVKVFTNDNNVWCGFEEKLPEGADLKDIVPYAVDALFQARIQFYERMKNN